MSGSTFARIAGKKVIYDMASKKTTSKKARKDGLTMHPILLQTITDAQAARLARAAAKAGESRACFMIDAALARADKVLG